MEIVKQIREQDPSINVNISQVRGNKMGSFEITCQGHPIFSKLGLGYFPHVDAVCKRIIGFVEDYRNGKDLSKYEPGAQSPVRSNSAFRRTGGSESFKGSPIRRPMKISYNKEYEAEK